MDHVLSIGALEQLLEDNPYALLPQCCLTERPVELVMKGEPL